MGGLTHFWLIRHARVLGTVGTIHGSEAPADLSACEDLERLRDALPVGATAFCSPARRTVETSRELGLQAKVDAGLREQNFGEWTGRRHDDLATEDDSTYASFWHSAATNIPPGGESFAEQVARTSSTIFRLGEGEVVVVAHSGTVRAFLALALDIAPASALSFVIDPLSLTRVDRVGSGWRVEFVNRL